MNKDMEINCPECKDESFILQMGDNVTRAFCMSCEYEIDYLSNALAELMIREYEKNVSRETKQKEN